MHLRPEPFAFLGAGRDRSEQAIKAETGIETEVTMRGDFSVYILDDETGGFEQGVAAVKALLGRVRTLEREVRYEKDEDDNAAVTLVYQM